MSFSQFEQVNEQVCHGYGTEGIAGEAKQKERVEILLWTIEHTNSHSKNFNATFRLSRALSGLQYSIVCLTKPVCSIVQRRISTSELQHA